MKKIKRKFSLKVVGAVQGVLVPPRILPFAKMDINLEVFSEKPPSKGFSNGITSHSLGYAISDPSAPGNGVQRILAAAKLLRSTPHDVLHIHYGKGLFNWIAGSISLRPYIVSTMGDDVNLIDGDKKLSFLEKAIVRNFLKGADLVTTKSEEMCNRLVNMNIPIKNIKIVPWGIDSQIFSNTNPYTVFSEHNIDGNNAIILSTRSCKPFYRIKELIESYLDFQRQLPNTRLIVLEGAADREYLRGLKEYVSSKKLEKKVIFAHYMPHEKLPDYFAAASLCWSNAMDDGLPQTFLESLYCGTPVVANRLPVYEKSYPEGRGIFYVTDGNSSFSNKSISLLEDTAAFGQAQLEAKKFSREFPDIDACATDLFGDIRAIASSSHKVPFLRLYRRGKLGVLIFLHILSSYIQSRYKIRSR